MPLHNEDKELQIELARLQMQHAYMASRYVMVLSVTISLTLIILSVYLPFYIHTREPFFLNVMLIAIPILFALTLTTFLDYKRKEERLRKEIEELKKKYIW